MELERKDIDEIICGLSLTRMTIMEVKLKNRDSLRFLISVEDCLRFQDRLSNSKPNDLIRLPEK